MVKTREKDCHLISVGKDYKPKNLGFLHSNAQSRHVFPVCPNMSRPHTLAAPAYLLWLGYSQVVQHYLDYRHRGLFELRGDNRMSKPYRHRCTFVNVHSTNFRSLSPKEGLVIQ